MAQVFLLAVGLMMFGGAEAIGQVTYNGNGNTGFGGVLGNGSLEISDDGTTVTVTFNRGSASFDNDLVVYIDSESGGVSSTANLTDSGDKLRRAVSGFNGGTSTRSTVNFPTGFEADFALAADVAESNFAGVFGLVENGGHNFITTANISPSSNTTASSYTMTFDFSQINTSAGSESFELVATYLDQSNVDGEVFRSDEAVGDGISDGNPGQGTAPFVSYFEYASGNVDGDVIPTQSSGNWSNSSNWEGGTVPSSGDDVAINHDLTLDQDVTLSLLTISPGNTFTASDGTNGYTLTLDAGGTLANSGTLSASDGTIAAVGSGTASVPGDVTLNDVTVSTDDGTVTGLDLGSSNATVDGNLRIEEGGFVDTNPPEYGNSSTLVYDATGTTYGVGTEWSAASGAGYPTNVTIQNNTILDLSDEGNADNFAREMEGDLTVGIDSELDMNTMGATLTVQGDITVNGNLTLGSNTGGDLIANGSSVTVGDGGTVELQGRLLDLGVSADLDEVGAGIVTDGPDESGGFIEATRTVDNPASGVDVAGLGAVIGTSANLGDVTVTRGHAAQSGGGNNSIERYYDISPGQNNSGLSADLTFNYADAEVPNEFSESNLTFFKSDDGGSSWTQVGYTRRGSNQVTLEGIESFSRWTLGSISSPIPIELASFEAHKNGPGAVLRWTTASETNNSGFVVQHAEGDAPFEKAGWVDGAGTTAEAQDYRFALEALAAGTHRFRLKQEDLDGTTSVSETTTLTVQPNGAVAVQAAPNPVRHTSQIRVTTAESGPVTVALYDVLGRRVETLHEGRVAAEQAEQFTVEAASLAAGTYFLRVQGESFTETTPITVAQ